MKSAGQKQIKMTNLNTIPKITLINPIEGCKLYLEFSDGIKGIADLSHLKGKGVFELWNNEENFSKVHIDTNGGIVWNDEVDIDALNCYLKITNQTFEEYANS